MAYKVLDPDGVAYFWSKIKALIPSKVSDLTNDVGYITQSDLVQFYSGTNTPSSSLGENGDIYFQTE